MTYEDRIAAASSEREAAQKKQAMKIGGGIGIGFIVLLIIFLLLSTITIVPAGSRGVLLTWGKATETRSEGLNFKVPVMNDIIVMSVQTQKYEAKASAASKDLQDVSTSVALNYHLNPDSALAVYRDLSEHYADRIINPAVQESVKASTAGYTAEELITKRPVVKLAIDSMLAERLSKYGIIVDTISITEFQFSPDFTQAIEAKVTAQQQALKAENDLQRIKIEAEQRVASARAEAEAYKLVNEQLKQNPAVLQMEWIKRWSGILPTTIVGGDADKMMMVVPTK